MKIKILVMLLFLIFNSKDIFAQWDVFPDTSTALPSEEILKRYEDSEPKVEIKEMEILSVSQVTIPVSPEIPLPQQELSWDGNTILLEKFNGSTSGEVFGGIGYVDSLPNLNKALYLPTRSWIRFSPSGLSQLQNAGSIEFFIAPTAYSMPLLCLQLLKVNSAPVSGYVLTFYLTSDGRVDYGVWNWEGGGSLIGTKSIPLNTWSHICIAWDSGGSKIYVNGKLDVSIPEKLYPAQPRYLYLGYWNLGLTKTVYLDELRISNIARVRELKPICKVLDVPYLSQTDSRWGDEMYNHLTKKIRQKGCAITSACMVLLFHGMTTGIDGKEVNPKNLNEWLKNNKGYYEKGKEKGDLKWWRLGKYSNDKIKYDGWGQSSVYLKEFLDSNQPLILKVPSKPYHFVVATGEKCTKTWTINDPNPAKGKTDLETGYGITKDNIDQKTSARRLKKAQTDWSGIYLIVGGDNEILLINSEGKKTGFVNGSIVEEIPNSWYGKEGIDDHDNPDVMEPVHTELGLKHPIAGRYTIKVIGTIPEQYFLDIDATDKNGEYTINALIMEGLIDSGKEHEYKLNYSPVPGEPVQLIKIVSFQTLRDEINIARKLNFIDNDGIQNSLLKKVENAEDAKNKDQINAVKNMLEAFINEVESQTEKHITKEASKILIEDVKVLIDSLR